MEMEISKTVGIWIEALPGDLGQGDNPEAQESRARHYARAKGWAVREIYLFEQIDSEGMLENSEVKRMLNDVKKGWVSGLIMSRLANLARNTNELLKFSNHFKENDADLIALDESIDTSTPAGKIFFTIYHCQ